MTRSKKYVGVLTLAAAALVGCASTFKATYDHDPSVDFTRYKTYAWISDKPMTVAHTERIVSPLLQPRIMAAIEDALNAKGYSKAADRAAADFALAFTVGSREEIKVDTYPTMYGGWGYPGPGRWGGAYYGVGYGTDTKVRQYQEGTLAVDIFDAGEHRPVWHGAATKSINDSDRRQMDATISAAVAAILEGFPPG